VPPGHSEYLSRDARKGLRARPNYAVVYTRPKLALYTNSSSRALLDLVASSVLLLIFYLFPILYLVVLRLYIR
jgi:hypothetical protein